jgi:hypothetical protein
MAITLQQVEEACGSIGRDLEAFRASPDRLSDLQGCLAGLQWLRECYRQDKTLMASYVDRLRELSRQVREALSGARESLTERYLKAAAAMSAWEAIRDACRDALVELSGAENVERFDSAEGWVQVRRVKSMSLPKIGTDQREQLSALITQAARWPDVAFPSAPRLLKALEGGLFSPDQAAEIARLCPTRTTCRLISHPDRR